jgi:hypothetical protein
MRPIRLALTALAALFAVTLFAPPPAAAIEYPWCARFGGSADGASNCGFVSFQQCLDYIHGIGGFCERNNFYRPEKPVRKSNKDRRD